MTFTFEEEKVMRALDRAGQVALEYLRANRIANVDSVSKEYLQIFKEVYKKTVGMGSDKTE